jgi:sugar lactone lactonase YvrE
MKSSLPRVVVAGCIALTVSACAPEEETPAESGVEEINDWRTPPSTPTSSGVAAQYEIPGPDLFPEGGAYDPVGRAFYLGSLVSDTVSRLGVDRAFRTVVPSSGRAGRATLGMKVDAARRRLWACTVRIDGTRTTDGAVRVVDLTTNTVLREVALSTAAPGASCNDLALDASGDAYVTDRENPRIYRVTADGVARVWTENSRLAPEQVGLNGAAFTTDGQYLLVVKYLPARLLRVSVADPSRVDTVMLRGDTFSGGVHFLNGADGMAFVGSDLYVAFGAKVARVRPDSARWDRATVATESGWTGLTAITSVDGEPYAVQGQAVRRLLRVAPSRPFRVVRLLRSWFDAP